VGQKKLDYNEEFSRRPYYPNNIGYLKPASEFDFEFLIIGKDIPGAPYKVINFFLSHYVRLLGIKSLVDENRKEFMLSLLCDMEDSDLPPKDLADEVRKKMQFVTCLESMEMRARMFGRSFPLTFYDKHRAVALGSSTMIKLALRLARKTGADGPLALYEEGRLYAKEVLAQLVKFLDQELPEMRRRELQPYSVPDYENEGKQEEEQQRGKGLGKSVLEGYCVKCRSNREIQNPEQVIFKNKKLAIQGLCPRCGTKMFRIGLLTNTAGKGRKLARLTSPLIENMQGFLSSAGWGAFEIRSEIAGEEDEEGSRVASVTVLDPPSLRGHIASGNQFLQGIAAGFLESVVGTANEMKLIGEKYTPERRELTLQFAQQLPPIFESTHFVKNVNRRKKQKQREKKANRIVGKRRRKSSNKRKKGLRRRRKIVMAPIISGSLHDSPRDARTIQQEERQVEKEVEKIIRSLEEIEGVTNQNNPKENNVEEALPLGVEENSYTSQEEDEPGETEALSVAEADQQQQQQRVANP
jgi:hypothetical protein